jgi:cytoskeletal protein CcmA (bactofilin family)
MWKRDQSVTPPHAGRVYGQMEGSIRLPDHTLTIGPQADIKADISAKGVVIMGRVTGKVTAGEKVEIQATGSVTGDIDSPRLAIVMEVASAAASRCQSEYLLARVA